MERSMQAAERTALTAGAPATRCRPPFVCLLLLMLLRFSVGAVAGGRRRTPAGRRESHRNESRVMHTKQLVATTYCVPGSLRLTVRLPWDISILIWKDPKEDN